MTRYFIASPKGPGSPVSPLDPVGPGRSIMSPWSPEAEQSHLAIISRCDVLVIDSNKDFNYMIICC